MYGQTTAPDPARLIAGADLSRPLDALFVNAPLRDYAVRPRVNDFTLPVLRPRPCPRKSSPTPACAAARR
jgi:hypothetical protein